MIDEPGSFSGKQQLAQAAARSGSEPAHVVGDLHQRDRKPAQRRHRRDHRVERTLRGELVGRGHERVARQLGDLGRDLAAEIRRRVEAGADGGPPGRQFEQTRLGGADAPQRVADLLRPSRPLLPDGQRHGVLQMRPPDLDDIAPFIRLRFDRAASASALRQQMLLDFQHGGDVHRGREGIVRRLAHVDVIVRMHRRFAADLAAEQLDGAVRQHLVDVHV